MRLALLHAVQIESRLDGEMSALELARRSAVERLASRDRSGFRRRRFGQAGLRRRLGLLGGFGRRLWLGGGMALLERPRAIGHPLPQLGVVFAFVFALAHA